MKRKLLAYILIASYWFTTAQSPSDSFMQSGNYLNAMNWLKLQDESAEKYYKLGNVYYEIGNYNTALKYFLKSLEIKSNRIVKQALAINLSKQWKL